MKYKKNFFFVIGIFIIVLSHILYSAEYKRTLAGHRSILTNVFLQNKKQVDDLNNNFQKLNENMLSFKNLVETANFKDLNAEQIDVLLLKAKSFGALIMELRQTIEESRIQYYEILMPKKEQCAIVRNLEDMYTENNDVYDLLFIAKGVKNLNF